MSASTFVELMKTLATNVNNTERPVSIHFGTVLSEEPDITIKIDQKKILTKEFITLARNVTDHNVDMTVDHWTEDADPTETSAKGGGAGDAAFESHSHEHSHKHPYKGRKTFLVHRKLLVGEKVIVLSVQGGQNYVVLDRIGSNIQ